MAMAWLNLVSVVTVLSFVFCGSSRVTAISTEELDGALTILRAQGHMLFANAISTSDMLFDILSLRSLTLLAPTDPTVFALDMTNTPPFYISTLRLHALPLRLSWSQLRLLSNGSLLPTLLPGRQLRLLRRQQFITLVADGVAVDVVMPGLYYTSDVAVHALGGLLTLRSNTPTDTNLFFPRNDTSTNNNTFFLPPPLPRIPTINNRTTPFFPTLKNTSTINNRTTRFFPTVNNTSNRTLVFPPPLPRIPIISRTNPTHSPSPAPAPDRQMGEVLARGGVCALGRPLTIWTRSDECVGE